MYFPYLRGRQYELIGVQELLDNSAISPKVIPVIEPVRASSTLINTLNKCNQLNQPVAFIINPKVGQFAKEFSSFNKKDALLEAIKNDNVIKAYIVDANIDAVTSRLSKFNTSVDRTLFVFDKKDFINGYTSALGANTALFNLIPDERDFRRNVHANRVILSDPFRAQDRNSDYSETPELFSCDHMYYASDGYCGFADYSIVGNKFSETGFAPYCLVIHIVYFDENTNLMIRHFRSRSNEDTSDPANKFHEALDALLDWNETAQLDTYALRQFKQYYDNGDYPGLGTIKKLSIMHHVELINTYLNANPK